MLHIAGVGGVKTLFLENGKGEYFPTNVLSQLSGMQTSSSKLKMTSGCHSEKLVCAFSGASPRL